MTPDPWLRAHAARDAARIDAARRVQGFVDAGLGVLCFVLGAVAWVFMTGRDAVPVWGLLVMLAGFLLYAAARVLWIRHAVTVRLRQIPLPPEETHP